MLRRFAFFLALCIVSLAIVPAPAAEDPRPAVPAPAAADVKYAAMVLSPSEGASTMALDSLRDMRYLLADPMAGDFPLEVVELSQGEGASALDNLTATLRSRDAAASVAFVYMSGDIDKILAARGGSLAAFSAALPGKTKLIVIDRGTPGPDDAKPSLAVSTAERQDGSSEATLDFSGQAGAKNSAAALLVEAFRGGADKDRNRVLTVGELASFLAEKASPAAPVDLGPLSGVAILKYRTPAVVAAEIGPDKSLALAAEYAREERWVEALLVLHEIRESKITDPEYRAVSEAAQLNLALEARYGDQSRDENVRRDADAGLELMSDMLLLADLHYVSEVDNRALFEGGVKNLELLLDNSKLRSKLVPPGAEAAIPEFKAFLGETIDHVKVQQSLSENDFRMRVKRVLMENEATAKLPPGAVVTEFVYGIPAALDPNTDFIPQRAYKEFQDETMGHFGGLGIEITLEDKILTVVTPIDQTPASDAGLLPGDRIVAINGRKTDGMDLEEAVALLRGPVGTKVTVTIVHRGDTTPVDVSITRGNITLESVKGYAVDPATGQWQYTVDAADGIAYVRLTDFKEDTPDELDRVVTPLLAQGMKAMVLDLRFNHGGLLNSGVKVTDRFLASGTIVTVKGEHSRPVTFSAHYLKTYKDFHLVLLVNDQTASAAEILAGALKDNHRAELVGTRTFGKGTVQTIFGLERGQAALKLTTAKYYTPSGVSIHREPYSPEGGLTPDVVVPMSDEDNARLFDVWHLRGLKKQARERLSEMEKDLAAKNPDFKIADPDAFKDPQLEKALEILRVELHPAGETQAADSSPDPALEGGVLAP